MSEEEKPVDKSIKIKHVDPNTLIASEYNPRFATDEDYNHLKASLQKFGLVDPIIANCNEARANIVIGGHFRLRVAKDLGMEKVPVIFLDIAELRVEQELNLRLNNNAGKNDLDLLANLDTDLLKEVGFDVEKLFTLDGAIPSLEDVIFDVDYEPNWVVLRFDDSIRDKVLTAIEPFRTMDGVKVDVAQQ